MRDKESNILPIGTQLSGYIGNFTKPGQGSGCWNCIHLDIGPPTHCEHPMVQADFDVPKDDEGHTLVATSGCCTYIRRSFDK